MKTLEEAWEHYQEFAIPPLMTKEQFADIYAAITPKPPTLEEHLSGWAPGNLQHHLVFVHGVAPSKVPYDGPLRQIHEEAHRKEAEK